MTTTSQGRISRVTAFGIACALAIATAGVAVQAPVDAEEDGKSRPIFRQFLWENLESNITSEIAMTDFDPTDEEKPSSAAFATSRVLGCSAKKRAAIVPDPEPFPLYVFDLVGEGQLKRPKYWQGGAGCFEPLSLDMSTDGKIVVAQVATDFSTGTVTGTCPAGDPWDGTNYATTQIVTWSRSDVGEDFGEPVLVTRASVQPAGCTGAAPDASESEPALLIGAGGDSPSYSPSISADGSLVAFTSGADNFGVGPLDTVATRALFVAGSDGTNIEMVTPAGFEGVVSNPQISGDGQTVTFSAHGDGMVPGVTDADHEQIFVARRSGSAWSAPELVSEKDGEPLDGSSNSPQIDADGERVVFSTGATDIEDDVTTSGTGTTQWLVARNVSNLVANPLKVVLDPNDDGAGYPSDGGLGDPTMSADGRRVAVLAKQDDVARFRLYDLTKVLGEGTNGEADRTDALVRNGSRSLLGYYNMPLGLGGNATKSLVALGGDAPIKGYGADDHALYLGWGGGIGPGISKGLHGDPVDTANGAFLQEETDLPTDRAAQLMGVSRSYSSVGEQTGIFGPGWATPIDTYLDLTDENGSVTLELPSGRAVLYREIDDEWSTDTGFLAELAAKSGGGWELTEPNGDVWTFDGEGILTGWASTNASVTLGTRAQGVPATVTADNGYTLTLTDNKRLNGSGVPVNGADGRVDRITASDGRIVDYKYILNQAGTVLSSASKPHLASQAAGTYGERSYTTDGAKITRISDRVTTSAWRTVVENTYDAKGRVAAQVTETGDELTYAYGLKPAPPAGLVYATGFTTVTNAASGDVTVYQYGPDGEVLGITDALGNSIGKSWEDEKPGSTTSRSGIETSYTYDDAGRVLTVSETVGSSTTVVNALTYITPATDPDALADQRVATSTDAAGVTTTYTYEGDLTVPATASVPCDEASLSSALDCPTGGKATTTFDYDTTGPTPLLIEQTDPDGVTKTLTYHSDDTLASSTIYDDGGTPRTTTFEKMLPEDPDWPFSNPAIASAMRTEQPGGQVSWEAVDASGQVVETRDPLYNDEDHLATTTSYNLDGSVAWVQDPSGSTTFFSVKRAADYDPADEFDDWDEDPSIAEVRTAVDSDGVASINKIDRSGDTVVSQVGDLGTPAELATTTNSYGPLGRLETSVGPTGVVTTYHYNVEGAVTGVTTGDDPDEPSRTVTTDYDNRGRVSSRTTPMGTDPDGNPVQRKVSYTYDAAGRIVATLQGDGGPAGEQLLTGYQYDGAGHLWRTIEHRHSYTDTANPATLHNADRVTETRYTLAGRVAQEVGPPLDVTTFAWSSPDSAKSITAYEYDEAGRRSTVHRPDGGTTATAYDENGLVASTTSPGGIQVSYVHDDAGRQIELISPSGLTGSGDPATVSTVTTYDGAGRVVSETDPHIPDGDPETDDPSTRYTEYSPGGRVAAATDANGNTVTYAYDSRGNRVSRTALDDAGSPVVESWAYNLADQEVGHTVPAPRAGATAKTTVSTYDAEFGRLATVTDPTGRVRSHSYYNDGAPKQNVYTYAAEPVVTDKFWVNGRGFRTKASTTSPSARAWTYTYDRAGQMLTETSTHGTTSHTYGLAGEQLTLGYPDTAATSSYLHDPAGRLTEVSVTSGGVTVPYSSYTYDDDGRQTSELIHAAGGATRTWAYDDAGNLTDFTEVLPNTTSTWETYTSDLTYRPDGRLETETVNADPTVTYGYDDAGQLTSAVDGVRDRSWTYGTRGNRLTSVDGGVSTTYTTNPNGSVAKATTGADTITYTYDDAGRRYRAAHATSGTVTSNRTNGFTPQGYPTAFQNITTGSPKTTEYRYYDPDGKMITSDTIVTGGTSVPRHYEWDTTQAVPQIIDARNSGATWFRATWGNQRIAYKAGSAAPQWFQYDARGSVIRTDPTNTAVVNGPVSYSPFGETGTAPGPDRIGYRGELTASDLIHLRARNYDPRAGQFLSQDLLDGVDGTPGVANPYQYTDNDPLNRSDPLGLRAGDELYISANQCFSQGGDYFLAEPVAAIQIDGAPASGCISYDPCADEGIWGIRQLRNYGCDHREGLLDILQTTGSIASGGFCGLVTGPIGMITSGASGEVCAGIADRYMTNVRSGAGLLDGVFDVDVIAKDAARGAAIGAAAKGVSVVWGRVAGRAGEVVEEGATAGTAGRSIEEGVDALCSFSADTQVRMASGGTRSISEVRVGDMVLAADPETGDIGAREVIATIPHVDLLLSLRTSSGEILTTEDHRYWNETDRAWQESKELDEGDQLLTADGEKVTVEGLRWSTAHTAPAYDLDISGFDTFYVGVGDASVLVHNCDWVSRTERAGDLSRYTESQTTRSFSEYEHMTNDELIGAINAAEVGEGINVSAGGQILDGHHRWDELLRRVADGRIDPNTAIRVWVLGGGG